MTEGILIVFNGRPYRKYPHSKCRSVATYYISHPLPNKRTYLHRDIWEFHNGKIPPKHEIHHKDGNPENNDISNLECVTRQQHFQKHSELARTNPELDKYKNSREWHKSLEGREWHKQNGADNWKKREKILLICSECKKEFEGHNTSKIGMHFCSGWCTTKNRRKSGIDNIQRKCLVCMKEFMCNRYKPRVTCGKKCQALQFRKTRFNR